MVQLLECSQCGSEGGRAVQQLQTGSREREEYRQETFISKVVVTRNFYTHAGSGKDSKRKPVPGKAMFLLNQKMRCLLRGVMLLYLGLPESQIAEILKREATKWH